MLRVKLVQGIFGNDAGEDEDPIQLKRYFVNSPKFEDFFDENKKVCVVSGKKGMGKSALLTYFYETLKEETDNEFVIKETGNSLLGLCQIDSSDQAYLENYWKSVICQRINLEIGRKINLPISSTELAMVSKSEIMGFKDKNILRSLLERIKIKTEFNTPLGGLSAEISQSSESETDPQYLLANYLKRKSDYKVWILIDDIDAKYLDDEYNQARVGAFFSAIRSLTNEVNGLYVRTTIRSDVWTNLRYLEDLDKWEQYVIEILWNHKEIRDILAKQILAHIQKEYPQSKEAKYKYSSDYNKLFQLIFEHPISWQSNPNSSIFAAIHAFSNKRPRWMNQLCRMSVKYIREVVPQSKEIKLDHLNKVLKDFGKNRKADLLKEHKHQFEDLDNFIDSFRNSPREFDYEKLKILLETKYLRSRDVTSIGKLDGKLCGNVHDLGSFAYKIGLISHKNGNEFTHYADDPDLFDSQYNRNNELNWSIHICYWEYLALEKN